jgi:hypothetical protein
VMSKPPKKDLFAAYNQHVSENQPLYSSALVEHKSRCRSCGENCVRTSMLGLNGLFVILGIVLAVLGGYSYYLPLIRIVGKTLSVLAILVGVLVICLSLFGIGATIRKSRDLLCCYIVVLMLSILVEGGLGIFFVTMAGTAKDALGSAWSAAPNNIRTGLQNDLTCCGWSSFNVSAGQPCPQNVKVACFSMIENKFSTHYLVLGVFAVLIAFTQVSGVVLSCIMRKQVDMDEMDELEMVRQKYKRDHPMYATVEEVVVEEKPKRKWDK